MASATPDLRLPSQSQAIDTKLYCLVTEAHLCEQLAQCRYLTAKRPRVELATSGLASQRVNHCTTMQATQLVSVCQYFTHRTRYFSASLAQNTDTVVIAPIEGGVQAELDWIIAFKYQDGTPVKRSPVSTKMFDMKKLRWFVQRRYHQAKPNIRQSVIGHVGANWRIRLNLCFLQPTQIHNPDCKSLGSAIFCMHSSRKILYNGRPFPQKLPLPMGDLDQGC